MSENKPKASGAIFVYSREYILDNYGQDVWQQITDHLTVEEKKFVNSDYSPGEWYPAYLLNTVLNTFDNLLFDFM